MESLEQVADVLNDDMRAIKHVVRERNNKSAVDFQYVLKIKNTLENDRTFLVVYLMTVPTMLRVASFTSVNCTRKVSPIL